MPRKYAAIQRAIIESLETRRLLSGGVLDTTFNNGHGVDSVNLGKTGAIGLGMAVQSDGKIVEVGGAGVSKYALIRLKTDGSLDTTFGSSKTGEVTGTIANGTDQLNAVAIQSDGKIVAVGQGFGAGTGNFIILRFLSNGTLDKSFGSFGVVTLTHILSSSGKLANATAVAIQKDGRIIVGGYEDQGALNLNDNMIMARLNTNGTLDTSFGDGGETNLDLGKNESTTAIAIDYNGSSSTNSDYGRIVIVGHQAKDESASIGEFPADQYKMVVARYKSNGKLDTSFAGNGHEVTTIGIGGKSIDANSAVIESGGKIVIAGSEGPNIGSTGHDFFLTRFNSNGNPDLTFGTNAVTTTNFGGDDYANSLVIGSLGQQLIAGGASSGKFALSAYSLDGKIFGAFGTNGMVTTKADNKVTSAKIALAPNNKIVAAGGPNFNTARYSDITLGVSVTSPDDAATEGTVTKHVGKKILHVTDPATMIVTRDQSLPTATRVFFNVGGSANIPNAANIKLKKSDYTLTGMTVSTSPTNAKTTFVDIPAGQTSVMVTFNAVDDSIAEPTETASFTIASNSNYSIGSPSLQVMSILDNDSPVVTSPTFIATADAYVKDGTSANSNFGAATQMVVKKSSTSGSTRQSYIKFDLSSLKPGTPVNNVTLELFGNLNNTDAPSLDTQVFSVADNSWTETGITFNNKPAAGSTALATTTINGTSPQLYTFDVSSFVIPQLMANKTTLSFVVKNASNSSPAILFNARESSTHQPMLVIT